MRKCLGRRPPDLTAAVLVVVDIQNDFSAGGALAVPDAEAVVPVVNGLMREFRHGIDLDGSLAEAWDQLAKAGVRRG